MQSPITDFCEHEAQYLLAISLFFNYLSGDFSTSNGNTIVLQVN
jgi:hypothetical protein